jgi:hypothetical protein
MPGKCSTSEPHVSPSSEYLLDFSLLLQVLAHVSLSVRLPLITMFNNATCLYPSTPKLPFAFFSLSFSCSTHHVLTYCTSYIFFMFVVHCQSTLLES